MSDPNKLRNADETVFKLNTFYNILWLFFPPFVCAPERTTVPVCACTRRSARPSHVTTPRHACAKKYKMAESAELKVRRSLKSF